MKCMAPHFLGDFKLKGSDLRSQGINRLGNLLVPNENYVHFEEFVHPLLDKMTDEQVLKRKHILLIFLILLVWLSSNYRPQVNDGVRWTPSRIIARLGKEIDNPESVYYWAYKNNIPVFSPAITDGSLGDMMYFHSYKRPEFVCDVVRKEFQTKKSYDFFLLTVRDVTCFTWYSF